MSFASAVSRFAKQAARLRPELSRVTIQPYDAAGAASGSPIQVFLTPVRAERDIADNGFIILHKAQLRVAKTFAWQPAEGLEFVNTSTAERFRCNTATGAESGSAFAAETVCEAIRISP